jgi:prepilin-type processing-associated H-X9-DG protein
MAVTMPAMNTARSGARAVVCRSNLRQLVLANIQYANDHECSCVPAAEDLWASIGPEWGQNGYRRWHGERTGPDQPFDPKKGLLFNYLGSGKIKECPERVDFTKNQPGKINFENGCGGYGYNMLYIGSRLSRASMPVKQKYAETAQLTEIKRPGATVMFTDAAFYQDNQYLIEYSFAEPSNLIINGKVHTDLFATPSVHFRHHGSANIGWADGHVEAKPMAKRLPIENYTAEMAKMNIGWFEPLDNTLFDLE